MDVNYIALAVPFFFLAIGVEVLVHLLRKKDYYRFNDAVNNLSCGILDQILDVFLKAALFAGYLYVYEHHALLEMRADAPLVWLGAFLGVDFCYYWFHRASHEVALIWGSHIVHHQSEEFNLTVALRQDAFQQMFSWVFYLPLALVGLPPVLFLTMSAFNTLYQFWIHTRAIGKLGPLEWVLNTPSHHRVHHGSDLPYLDKNYAGTLIVWDRLFGSFQAEQQEPHYGIVKPLSSWNPLWAHAQYFVALAGALARAPRLRDKLRLCLRPPGWDPRTGKVELPAPGTQSFVKYDPRVPRGLNLYVLAQFVPILAFAVHFLDLGDRGTPLGSLLLMAGFIALTLTCCGALLEARGWGLRLELGRLVLVGAFVSSPWMPTDASLLGAALAPVLLLAALASGFWLLLYRSRFVAAPSAALI